MTAAAPGVGPIDTLDAEAFGPLGAMPLVVIDLAEPGAERAAARLASGTQTIVVGVDRVGLLPAVDPAPFDCLLTVQGAAPRPWVSLDPRYLDRNLTALETAVAAAPVAASTLARVLRINSELPLRDALVVESLAYSTLLGGAAFRRWRKSAPPTPPPCADCPCIDYARDGDRVTLTLACPETRNAMSAAMRDALFEALAAVADDPSRPTLVLRGEGACFSVGGDLGEFGTATDFAGAHAIRTARSCAALLASLGDRAEARLHGACIGSGIEIAAAAARRIAASGSFFQLPELALGLIPGAGGTATVARAIGRHRTGWLGLSGRRINAATALAWGLIDAIEPV